MRTRLLVASGRNAFDYHFDYITKFSLQAYVCDAVRDYSRSTHPISSDLLRVSARPVPATALDRFIAARLSPSRKANDDIPLELNRLSNFSISVTLDRSDRYHSDI